MTLQQFKVIDLGVNRNVSATIFEIFTVKAKKTADIPTPTLFDAP